MMRFALRGSGSTQMPYRAQFRTQNRSTLLLELF